MGLVNYHRQFVSGLAEIAPPLYAILVEKEPFRWKEEQVRAFVILKNRLTSLPLLTLPSKKGVFVLDTDESYVAVTAVLSQVQGGVEKVDASSSYALSAEQHRYYTTMKDLLVIVRFTRQYMYRVYFVARRFLVRADHAMR